MYFDILRQTTLFMGLSNGEIESELKRFNAILKNHKKGEILQMSGSPLKKFGMVLYGSLNVLSDDVNGNRTIMAEVTRGNTFGESLCFLRISKPNIYVSAIEDSVVLWLSVDNLFENARDSLENRFTQMMAKRTLVMNNRIQILSKLTLREKLVAYFNLLIKQNNSSCFEIPFNREDMATYIGTNRSALSRELSKMKKEGLIDYNKNKFTCYIKKL